MRTTLLVLVVATSTIPLGMDSYAQSESGAAKQRRSGSVSFEVASVRENRLSRQRAGRPIVRQHPAGHFNASWVTLRSLIMSAYDVPTYRIVDAPGWIATDRFDIDAKAPESFEQGQTWAMVRSLLEERFGLIVHKEKRRLSAYALDWVGTGRRLGAGIREPSAECDDIPPRASSADRATRRAQERLRSGGADKGGSRSECPNVVGYQGPDGSLSGRARWIPFSLSWAPKSVVLSSTKPASAASTTWTSNSPPKRARNLAERNLSKASKGRSSRPFANNSA